MSAQRLADLAARREAARRTFETGGEAARDPRHSAEYTRELLRPLAAAWGDAVGRLSADIGAARRMHEGERATMLRDANAPLTAAEAPAVAAVYDLARSLVAPEPRGDVARRAIAAGDTLALRALLQAPQTLDLLPPSMRQGAEDGLLAANAGRRFTAWQEEGQALESLRAGIEQDARDVYQARFAIAEGQDEREAVEMADIRALMARAGHVWSDD